MRQVRWLFFITYLFCSLQLLAGDIDKAFKYLNTGDYTNAYKFLMEVVREDPEHVAANYGMAKYYSLRDNAAFNIDSANAHIKRAAAKMPLNPEDKQNKKFLTLGVRDYTIQTLQREINVTAYNRSEEEHTVESYQFFIDNYTDKGLLDKAVNMRNQLAFVRARGNKTPEALSDFLKRFPESREAKEAKELYEKLIYEQITEDGSYQSYKKYIDSYPTGYHIKEARKNFEEKILEHYNGLHELNGYEEFIRLYPNHPARSAVDDSIYILATSSGSIDAFSDFIKKHKEHPRLREAWNNLYLIYTTNATEELYRRFMEEYPDYPEKTRVEKDLSLSRMDLKPYQQGEKWGYAVQPTKDSIAVIIPFEYEEAFDFHCGLAAVRIKPCTGRCTYFYIDKADRRAFGAEFNYAGDFTDGYAIAGIGNCEEDSCLYGIINKSGVWVVKPVYEELNEPSEGVYLAAKNDRYGFINHKGETVISMRYTDATSFREGVAAVAMDSMWFFIDHTGRQLFFDGFYNVSSFSDSLCAATRDGENWGYINKEGVFVIQPQYESAEDFEAGYAIVSKKERDPKYKTLTISQRYKIDKTGKVIEKLTAPKPVKATQKSRRAKK